MRKFRFLKAGALSGLAVATLVLASPANAQYIGETPPPPAAPRVGTIESPAAALARNVRLLAANPRDFNALMAAGRAELELGDLQAAAGFFGRADELRPNDPAPKIGMGATTIQTGDAAGALSWFAQAQRLGASAAMMGADRGLAHDLLGELSAAQADYRAALYGPTPDEARRRLALSLAIGGQMRDALAALAPLSARGDPATPRLRAFILALGGDKAQAVTTIERSMPGSSARIGPFFDLLPRLSIEQKAAAVHLGIFPTSGEIQLAAVQPPPPKPVTIAPSKTASTQTRAAKSKKLEVGKRVALAPTPIATAPVATQTARPAFSLPSQQAGPPPASQQIVEAEQAPVETASLEPIIEIPTPEPLVPVTTVAVAPTGDRLSGIDKLLAQAIEPKPAPSKKAPSAKTAAADKKARDAKAAADKKAADKKAAEEKKAKEAAAKLGVSGTHWVQLAGGSNADRMSSEYNRIKAKKPALFSGKNGYVTAGKDYFRLLVGPFDDADDARGFVNKLAKAGIDGFSWTRTPAQIKIEKLKGK